MLIYCEGCKARYQVDLKKINQEKPVGKCGRCGRIINLSGFLYKPENDVQQQLFDENISVKKAISINLNQMKPVSLTSGLGFRIMFPFIALVMIAGAGMALLYFYFVPDILSNQISLRAQSISRSFSAGILQPLLLKNYLAVNRTASMHADFPDVAYVAVLNQKNLVVAGIMNRKDQFSKEFRENIEKNGFPAEMITESGIDAGSDVSVSDINAGGRKIIDAAVRIPESLGIVHVGLFRENAETESRRAFWPVITFLALFSTAGAIAMIGMSRSIVIPIHRLTCAAQKIALGDTNEPIRVHGKGEIEALSASLEMMRNSINMAIVRLRRRNRS